jgi:sulfoxide reductase catalytic subunit YedY
MFVHRRRGWEIPASETTPEEVFLNRRQALGIGAGLIGGGLVAGTAFAQQGDLTAGLYPAKRNERFTLDRPVTDEAVSSQFNNFYEFGSSKRVAAAARALQTRPWTVRIDGMVEAEKTWGVDDLIKQMTLEERLYRLRCVEAWAMAVPWTGFPLKALVDLARPLSGARYVRFETFLDPKVASGQRQTWYPWPYVEGITIAEATNELPMLVTGVYGKPLANQFGAPLRLVVPWKYGFKSIKSITRISFVAERPKSFWEKLQASEYGFWANVNPAVPHPRWSQAEEEMIGTEEKRPTLIYNGYGEFVAGLYSGLTNEKLYL